MMHLFHKHHKWVNSCFPSPPVPQFPDWCDIISLNSWLRWCPKRCCMRACERDREWKRKREQAPWGLPFINLLHWQRSPSQTAPSNISHTCTNQFHKVYSTSLFDLDLRNESHVKPSPLKINIICPWSTAWMKGKKNCFLWLWLNIHDKKSTTEAIGSRD